MSLHGLDAGLQVHTLSSDYCEAIFWAFDFICNLPFYILPLREPTSYNGALCDFAWGRRTPCSLPRILQCGLRV